MAGERLRVNCYPDNYVRCQQIRTRQAGDRELSQSGRRLSPKCISHFKGQLAPAAVFYCARYHTLGAG